MDQYLKATRKKNARKYIKKKKEVSKNLNKIPNLKDQEDSMAKRLRNRRLLESKKSLIKVSSEGLECNNDDEAIFPCVQSKLVSLQNQEIRNTINGLGDLVSTELPKLIDDMLKEINSKSSVKDSQLLGFLNVIEGMVLQSVKEDDDYDEVRKKEKKIKN